MRRIFSFVIILSIVLIPAVTNAQKNREVYLITLYHFASGDQQKVIDQYLKNAYVPALHRRGIKNVGIFKPITNDTAIDKRLYVFFPLKHLDELSALPARLMEDQQYLENGKEYLDAPYNNLPYSRMENIVLHAFPLAPKMALPKLTSSKAEHIYELRSYESGTEKLYRNKVEMFNQGGEIKLFERLKFNAVFYAEVLSGSHMPNLMYMTSFENKADRDAHWKTFGEDAEWKRLSALPQYQKNVSKAEVILMKATEYSDY